MQASSTHRPGFTLIELLLVIGLLLAAGALVFPSMLDRMDDRAFDSATDVLMNQLLLARAHARAIGEPVEVLYQIEPICVIAQRFDPQIDAEMTRRGVMSAGAAETGSRLIAEDWAVRMLPRGFWIDADLTQADQESPFGGSSTYDMASADPAETHGMEPLRVVVFLPDGSALIAEPVWLGDGDGRIGRLAVNAWTGLPVFERVQPGATMADDEPDADGTSRMNPDRESDEP